MTGDRFSKCPRLARVVASNPREVLIEVTTPKIFDDDTLRERRCLQVRLLFLGNELRKLRVARHKPTNSEPRTQDLRESSDMKNPFWILGEQRTSGATIKDGLRVGVVLNDDGAGPLRGLEQRTALELAERIPVRILDRRLSVVGASGARARDELKLEASEDIEGPRIGRVSEPDAIPRGKERTSERQRRSLVEHRS